MNISIVLSLAVGVVIGFMAAKVLYERQKPKQDEKEEQPMSIQSEEKIEEKAEAQVEAEEKNNPA